jgi:hypothetical protein
MIMVKKMRGKPFLLQEINKMPTYNFYNKKSGEYTTEFMMISELDDFISKNKNLTLQVSAPAIHSGRGIGRKSKPDDGFRDVLKRIKKGNSKGMTRSTVNTF